MRIGKNVWAKGENEDMGQNWKPIDRVREYGNQTDFVETSEFPNEPIKHFIHNCNLTTCRYNKNGKCTNEEKRKECVEVSRKVLCEDEDKLST